MATQQPSDDRQHGHAIRRRQGGRTSIYHDQLYPSSAIEKNAAETFETYDGGDLVKAIQNGEPGALEEHARRARYAIRPVGSDSATGAY
jgi:hypothetical protein